MQRETQIAARITRNPQILGGKPIVRGTRVPVDLIVDFIVNGATPEEFVEDYLDLTIEDVEAALRFAEQELSRTEIRRW